MKNKKIQISIQVAFGLAILERVALLLLPGSLVFEGSVAVLFWSIVSVVLVVSGNKKLKENQERGKKLVTATMIINILAAFLATFSIAGAIILTTPKYTDETICPELTECVENEDETSTCDFMGVEVFCTTELLTEEQFK